MGRLLRDVAWFKAEAWGAKCKQCPIKNPYPVKPEVNPKAKLAVLLESPDSFEKSRGKPLVGFTGDWVKSVLRQHRIEVSDISWVFSTCCRMPRNFQWAQRKKMVEACRPLVEKTLAEAAPKTISACGQGSIYYTLGSNLVNKNTGLFIEKNGITIIPNFHPTFAGIQNRALRPFWITYFLRAWKAAHGELPEWKWPQEYIWPNEEALEALQRLKERDTPVAIDIETAGICPVTSPVMCIGLGDKHAAISLPWDSYNSVRFGAIPGIHTYKHSSEFVALVKEILENRTLITQNGQHDLLGLKRYGIQARNGFDTLRAFSTVAPQSQGYRDLETLAVLHLPGCPRWKTEFKAGTKEKGAEQFIERPEESLRLYNCHDVSSTCLLQTPIQEKVEQTHEGDYVYRQLMRQDEIAGKSRERGIKVDFTRIAYHKINLSRYQNRQIRTLQLVANKFDIENYNPNSHRQNNKFFFDVLKARPSSYSEITGEPKLDEKALAALITDDSEEIQNMARQMLRFRSYAQLLKILKSIKPDKKGILRAEPNVDGAQTGRWSYKSPNLHTIPKPKVEFDVNGKKKVISTGLRDIFVARKGSWIVEADYARLELYIIGILAKDPIILEAMKTGEDLHTRNCIDLFGRKDKQLRNAAKTFVYNVNYGPTDKFKLAQGVYSQMKIAFPKMTFGLVHELVNRWFTVHHWIDDYRKKELAFATRTDYSEEPVSRRRRYYEGKVKDTEVYNYRMQTMGSAIIGQAVDLIDRELKWGPEGLLLQLHDALYLEGPDPVRLCELLKWAMTKPIQVEGESYSFPIDWKVGKDMGSAQECATLDDVRKLTHG